MAESGTIRNDLFQSTPPARGATVKNDYPNAFIKISIHAPREGGDTKTGQSGSAGVISIHAPREGGDQQAAGTLDADEDFNPRPPRGGRRYPPARR